MTTRDDDRCAAHRIGESVRFTERLKGTVEVAEVDCIGVAMKEPHAFDEDVRLVLTGQLPEAVEVIVPEGRWHDDTNFLAGVQVAAHGGASASAVPVVERVHFAGDECRVHRFLPCGVEIGNPFEPFEKGSLDEFRGDEKRLADLVGGLFELAGSLFRPAFQDLRVSLLKEVQKFATGVCDFAASCRDR